jgi:hypothetical protein
MLRFALPALALLAGCSMTAEEAQRQAAADARNQAKLDKRLAGYVADRPQNCIQPNRSTNTEIFGDTIVYRDVGNRLYVNKTNGGCFGLKRQDIIITRSFTGQLCQGDIVRTADRATGFPTGSCAFGEFVPYRRVRG